MKIENNQLNQYQRENANPNYNAIEDYVSSLPEFEQSCHEFMTDSLKSTKFKAVIAQGKISPDYLNSGCIGKDVNIIGYYTDYIEVPDGIRMRVIMVDEDLQTYSTVSGGIAKIVKSWIYNDIYPTIDEPLHIKYEQVRKGNIQYYTVKLLIK